MKIARILFGLGITAFWLYMMNSIYMREYGFRSDPGGEVIEETTEITSWAEYSLLALGDQELGTVATLIRRNEDGGYTLEHRGRLQHTILDHDLQGALAGESRFDKTLALREVNYTLRLNGQRFNLTGTADDELLSLRFQGYKVDQEQVLPLSGPLRMEMGLTPFLVHRPDFAIGKKYRFNTFDPVSQSTKDVVIEVAESERNDADFLLITKAEGYTFSSWVTRDGETMYQATDIGLTTQGISRQSALALDAEAEDPINIYLSAPVDATLTEQNLGAVTLQIEGLHPRDYPIVNERQQQEGSPSKMRFTSETAEEATGPIPGSYFPYLSRDGIPGQVRAVAMTLMPEDGSGQTFLENLYNWMKERQRVVPSIEAETPLDTYLSHQGDSRSLTRLAVAMARVCGYPARCASGLVYRPGGYVAHFWPEIWIGEWKGFDPALGRQQIGPEYVAFASGQDINEEKMRRVVRSIRIEVIAQEPDYDTHREPDEAL